MIAHDFFPHNAYSQTDTLLESSAQLSLSAEYSFESVHSQVCLFLEVLRSDTVITIVDVLLQEVDNLFIGLLLSFLQAFISSSESSCVSSERISSSSESTGFSLVRTTFCCFFLSLLFVIAITYYVALVSQCKETSKSWNRKI